MMRRALILLAVAGCGTSRYEQTTSAWTRKAVLRGQYQEVLDLAAVFKSHDWRLAHAEREADHRNLTGPQREQVIAQAQADMAGPYEVELLVTTWDRRENDLDRGSKSAWRVRLLDELGGEIEPLEVVKDRRPLYVLRAEFSGMGDFATAYVAKFPRKPELRSIRVRLSSERGGIEVSWPAL